MLALYAWQRLRFDPHPSRRSSSRSLLHAHPERCGHRRRQAAHRTARFAQRSARPCGGTVSAPPWAAPPLQTPRERARAAPWARRVVGGGSSRTSESGSLTVRLAFRAPFTKAGCVERRGRGGSDTPAVLEPTLSCNHVCVLYCTHENSCFDPAPSRHLRPADCFHAHPKNVLSIDAGRMPCGHRRRQAARRPRGSRSAREALDPRQSAHASDPGTAPTTADTSMWTDTPERSVHLQPFAYPRPGSATDTRAARAATASCGNPRVRRPLRNFHTRQGPQGGEPVVHDAEEDPGGARRLGVEVIVPARVP